MRNLSIIVWVILLSLGVGTAQSGGDPKAVGASPQVQDKQTAKDAKVQQPVQPQSPITSPTPQSKLLTVQKTAAKDPSPAHTNKVGRPRKLANIISSTPGGGCIPWIISGKNLDCAVEDVTQNADGTTQVSEIPRCRPGRGSLPCWHLEKKSQCATLSPQGLGVTVDRGWDPPNATTQISCAN